MEKGKTISIVSQRAEKNTQADVKMIMHYQKLIVASASINFRLNLRRRSEDVAVASVSLSHHGAPQNAVTYSAADAIVKEMKAWYESHIDDKTVTKTWKHLHSVL